MNKLFSELGCAFELLGIILAIWILTRANDIFNFLDRLIK